jgi:hypothetical protein
MWRALSMSVFCELKEFFDMSKSANYSDNVSLCETLDGVLNKGVVVAGEIVISVADIDLIYLGLTLTLTSVETANNLKLSQVQEEQV